MYVENSHQKYLWMLTFVFLLKLVLGGTVQYESFYLCHVYLHQTKCFWTIDVPKFIKLMYGYTLSIWCNITLVVPCLNPTCNLSCWKMYNRIVPSKTWQEPILVYLRCCKQCIYYQPVIAHYVLLPQIKLSPNTNNRYWSIKYWSHVVSTLYILL